MRGWNNRGFTLIELMIAIGIIAILARIAFPAYASYVQKANRRAAQAQMMDLANRQQQYLLANRGYASYGTMTSAGFALQSEVSKWYAADVTVGTSAPPAFTITFTPSGSQANDPAGTLTLNSDGTKGCTGCTTTELTRVYW